MPRPLGPPPIERPNWSRLNRGQRLYSYREWNKARIARNLPPVPFPENQPYQPAVSPISSAPTSQPDPSPDIQVDDSVPDGFFDESFSDDDLPENSPLFSNGDSPFHASIPDIPDTEDDDYPPDNQMAGAGTPNQTPHSTNQTPPNSQGTPVSKRLRGRSRLPGTGGGGGAASDVAGLDPTPIPRPMTVSNQEVRMFKKVHRFISFGLAYKQIDIERTVGANTWSDSFIITPLAEIPWDRLFMYMNDSEFKLLPPGSSVKHMSVTVRSENVRIAFPTNSTTSNLATLNQNKFLRTAVGLRQTLQGVNVKPADFVDDKPMEVSAITELKNDDTDYAYYVNNFYGHPNNSDEWEKLLPRHQLGMPIPLQHYYAMVTQKDDQTNSGWPCLQEFVKEVEADSKAGEVILHMDYTPKIGLIKQPIVNIYTGLPSGKSGINQVQIIDGTGQSLPKVSVITMKSHKPDARAETSIECDQNWGTADSYKISQVIEKSQSIVPGLDPINFHAQTIPSLHVGLQPVIALTTSVINNESVDNYTDSQAYFEVTCECHVETAYPTYRPHATVPNTKMSNLLWHAKNVGASVPNATSMIRGLYQYIA